MKKQYLINQSYLYKCHSKKKLSKALQISIQHMKYLSKYPKYFNIKIHKKDSKEIRTIEAPSYDLKNVQKRIFNLVKFVYRPSYVIGGEKNKSFVNNAKIHAKNSYWIKFDISNFFPNCSRNYIYNFFLKELKCSPDVSNILTNLTTYNQSLVQGSSSSIILSFFAYKRMFNKLQELCHNENMIMSVYIDDVLFSSNEPIFKQRIINKVSKIFHIYGHKIKRKKVKYYGKNGTKKITGVIVTKYKTLKAPNSTKQEINNYKKLLKCLDKIKDNKKASIIAKKLIGRINYVRQIESNSFPELLKYAKKKSVY